MANHQALALPPAGADPFLDGPPPEHRRAWMRAVLETLVVAQPEREELRELAEHTHVPYLLLLLDWYFDATPRMLTPEDIAEWNADAEAQQALADWWATVPRTEAAEAQKAAVE